MSSRFQSSHIQKPLWFRVDPVGDILARKENDMIAACCKPNTQPTVLHPDYDYGIIIGGLVVVLATEETTVTQPVSHG